MNEEDVLTDKRNDVSRRLAVLNILKARAKKVFHDDGTETPMSTRAAWDLEIAELELQRHDIEVQKSLLTRARMKARATSVYGILVRILADNKLDHYTMRAVKEADRLHAQEEAHV